MTGQILRLRADKGFGFVKCDDDGKELFFHRTRCLESTPFEKLKLKDYVKFHLEDHEKGCRAVDLELR